MTEITIPFYPEMEEASLNGKKECTSRNKKYGVIGDTFWIRGRKYVLWAIDKRSLDYVSNNLYEKEGFDNPQGFIDIWNRIHPNKGFDPTQEVYVHFYKKVSEWK